MHQNKISSLPPFSNAISPKSYSISCPKCPCFSYITIPDDFDKTFKIFINCENKHNAKISIDELLSMTQKNSYNKLCCDCLKSKNNNVLLFCNICKKITCNDCVKLHNHIEKNVINLTKIGKICQKHYLENNYFCKNCEIHFCGLCKIESHFSHDVIDLKTKIKTENEINKLRIICENESKILQNEVQNFQGLISKLTKKFDLIIKNKKKITDFKNLLLKIYLSNQLNYYNIENLDIIEKKYFEEYNPLNYNFNQGINNVYDVTNEKNNNFNLNSINKKENNFMILSQQKKDNNSKFNINNFNIEYNPDNNQLNKRNTTNNINNINKNSLVNFNLNENINTNKNNNENNFINNEKNCWAFSNNIDTSVIYINNDSSIDKNNNFNSHNEKIPRISSENHINSNHNLLNNSRVCSPKSLQYRRCSSNYYYKNNNTVILLEDDDDDLDGFNIIKNYIYGRKSKIINLLQVKKNIVLLSLDESSIIKLVLCQINFESNNSSFKLLLPINIFKTSISDIKNIKKDENIFIACSKEILCKFKIILDNTHKPVFKKLFMYKIKNDSIINYFDFKYVISLNENIFLTSGRNIGLLIWSKFSSENKNNNYELKNLKEFENTKIISMQKINENKIVLCSNNKNNSITTIFLVILDNEKIIKTKNKNIENKILEGSSIKIYGCYLLILLAKGGVLIFDAMLMKVNKILEMKNVLFSDLLICNDVINYFVVKKNRNNYSYFEYKLLINKTEDNVNFGKLKYMDEIKIPTRSKIVNSGYIFKNNSNNIEENERYYSHKVLINGSGEVFYY